MGKKYYLILASITTFLYWMLDSYILASLNNSPFLDELVLKTPHTLAFMKVLTAGLIFTLTLTPLFFKQRVSKETKASSLDEFGELQRIADILFSSLSTKINVIKALEILEDSLHLEASLLFVYSKESLSLYNENEFIKASFRSKEILPFQTNATRSAVETFAISCFVEKRTTSQESIKLDKKQITLFSFALQEQRSIVPLGNLILATSDPKVIVNNRSMIEKFGQMLTFSLSLGAKKDLLQNLNTQYANDPIGPFDKILNIINFTKLQEHIEQEYKRHKRYHTALTLVLIDITMLKNLSKVFPAEVITTLKKDFIQLVKNHTREVDIFGKWTNDQFALLLPDVDFRAGQKVATKLQTILEETKFARVGKLSCSYGITSISPKDTIASFKARAESALASASMKEGNAIEVKLQMTDI